jgi:hypothetical protein
LGSNGIENSEAGSDGGNDDDHGDGNAEAKAFVEFCFMVRSTFKGGIQFKRPIL